MDDLDRDIIALQAEIARELADSHYSCGIFPDWWREWKHKLEPFFGLFGVSIRYIAQLYGHYIGKAGKFIYKPANRTSRHGKVYMQ